MSDGGRAGRVVVLDVVGLQPRHLSSKRTPALSSLCGGDAAPLRPPFPAVTVTSQTTLATGRSPAAHGDVANGAYDRDADAAEFWGRDGRNRERIWETARDAGVTTGALFFQHLVGTSADVAMTPSPIEDENNDLVEMNCWSNPDGFYDAMREEYGHFPLHNYWGPAAGRAGSEWILAAAREAVDRYDPDLLWVYVPHLDYAGLKHGPGPAFDDELEVVDSLAGEFVGALEADDRWDETAVAVTSEYGFHAVERPAFPNRALREAGLLEVEDDGDVDLSASRAFALVDHQAAHVYADADAVPAARAALERLDGVDEVRTPDPAESHPSAGELVLVADRDAWFQYYWWPPEGTAPPYATSVDIHAKPGFDPCELFLSEDGSVSLDPTRVGGSHGRTDPEVRGVFGVGGPAAPALDADEVDARAVAPTVADLLGVRDDVDAAFECESVL